MWDFLCFILPMSARPSSQEFTSCLNHSWPRLTTWPEPINIPYKSTLGHWSPENSAIVGFDDRRWNATFLTISLRYVSRTLFKNMDRNSRIKKVLHREDWKVQLEPWTRRCFLECWNGMSWRRLVQAQRSGELFFFFFLDTLWNIQMKPKILKTKLEVEVECYLDFGGPKTSQVNISFKRYGGQYRRKLPRYKNIINSILHGNRCINKFK